MQWKKYFRKWTKIFYDFKISGTCPPWRSSTGSFWLSKDTRYLQRHLQRRSCLTGLNSSCLGKITIICHDQHNIKAKRDQLRIWSHFLEDWRGSETVHRLHAKGTIRQAARRHFQASSMQIDYNIRNRRFRWTGGCAKCRGLYKHVKHTWCLRLLRCLIFTKE